MEAGIAGATVPSFASGVTNEKTPAVWSVMKDWEKNWGKTNPAIPLLGLDRAFIMFLLLSSSHFDREPRSTLS